MRGLINFDEPIPYRNYYHNDERTKPSKQELEASRLYQQCFNHIAGKRTFRDEYKLILEKKSTLPSACRSFIIGQTKSWSNEK